MLVERAQGCLLGQLIGDALGSLVEFQTPEQISRQYPNGVRELENGGTWNTIAGQPTDDSEMALMLARILAALGYYDRRTALHQYTVWYNSKPFDCGKTIAAGLSGHPDYDSQANGALMRISPLGIFGANHEPGQLAEWARADASLTHPHTVCEDANALYTIAIAHAIKTGTDRNDLYAYINELSLSMNLDSCIMKVVRDAAHNPPDDYLKQQGWVLISLHNAIWQLLHADNFEEALVDTVMRGGDTDTNAAICGALLGAVLGVESIPSRWRDTVLNCRPLHGLPGVHQPRPEYFWPVDALKLAQQLIEPDRIENDADFTNAFDEFVKISEIDQEIEKVKSMEPVTLTEYQIQLTELQRLESRRRAITDPTQEEYTVSRPHSSESVTNNPDQNPSLTVLPSTKLDQDKDSDRTFGDKSLNPPETF